MLEDHIEIVAEEPRRRDGVSIAIAISFAIHTLVFIYILRTYKPVGSEKVATPIVRYDIGDYAEVGAPCACGRGLPALTRIMGRRRGMLRYPDGRTVWPLFTVACRRAAHFAEIQLVQDAIDKLRVRVVPDGPLDPRALVAAIHGALGREFAVTVEVVESLRGPRGKLEEFVSLVRAT